MAFEVPVVSVFVPPQMDGPALTRELSGDGLDAVTVSGMDQFHELVRHRQIEVLVIAQQLGGFLSGLEIIERLQAELRHPAVILIGPLTTPQRKTADKLGVTAIVDDPEDRERIRTLVRARVAHLQLGSSIVTPAARNFAADANIVRPCPQLLTKLCTYLQSDLVSLEALADDIACDPRVTAELLKLINSTSVGLSRKITSVPEAVRFLGVRQTVAKVIATGALRSQSTVCQELPESIRSWYQSRSLLMACTAATVAEELEKVSGETAHVLGLLQDLGTLVLAQTSPKRYEQLLKRARTIGHLKREHLEREEFGVTHAEVSAALLERWEVPESLVLMVLDHHAPARRAGRPEIEDHYLQAMRVAEAVANVAENRVPQRTQALAACLARYGIDRTEDCKYCFATASIKAREQSKLFAIPTPDAEAVQRLLNEFAGQLPAMPAGTEPCEPVAIPAPEVSTIPMGKPSGSGPAEAKCRVLLIDDAAELIYIMGRMLKTAGFEVLEAMEARQAIAQANQADVIVCDVHLGTDHGADLVRQFRKAGATAPVIMISGDRSRETVTRCIEAGVVDYLVKPFTALELIGKVRACSTRKTAADNADAAAPVTISMPRTLMA